MPSSDALHNFEDWCVERSGRSEDFVLTWQGPAGRSCEVAWFGEPGELLADVREEGERRGFELSSIGTASFSADGFTEGLMLLGVDHRRGDDDDSAPLDAALVDEVRRIVSGLDGVHGVIAAADVRVESGRVVPL